MNCAFFSPFSKLCSPFLHFRLSETRSNTALEWRVWFWNSFIHQQQFWMFWTHNRKIQYQLSEFSSVQFGRQLKWSHKFRINSVKPMENQLTNINVRVQTQPYRMIYHRKYCSEFHPKMFNLSIHKFLINQRLEFNLFVSYTLSFRFINEINRVVAKIFQSSQIFFSVHCSFCKSYVIDSTCSYTFTIPEIYTKMLSQGFIQWLINESLIFTIVQPQTFLDARQNQNVWDGSECQCVISQSSGSICVHEIIYRYHGIAMHIK